jgi:hypothetical protein
LLTTGDYVDDCGRLLSNLAASSAVRAIRAVLGVRTADRTKILAGHLLGHVLGVLALVLDGAA